MQKLTYPSLYSAACQIPLSHQIPEPGFKELPSLEDDEDMANDIIEHDSDVDFAECGSPTRRQCFN